MRFTGVLGQFQGAHGCSEGAPYGWVAAPSPDSLGPLMAHSVQSWGVATEFYCRGEGGTQD